MIKIPSCFIALFVCILNAQTEKSLLWEISGNGLQESSYLYGTMHVSKKIAFRLDDVFFEALNASDFVALESDPSHWLTYYLEEESFGSVFGLSENQPKGFYRDNFKFDPPKKDLISAYLAMEDKLVNNILFRSDKVSQDFEEETYLDMFIFQTGKKLNKPIISLEDIAESTKLTMLAAKHPNKEKPDAWLQKKLIDDSYFNLLQNAYRERNIALIDSLDRGLYTEHYLKNMLFIRNGNMVKRLDSIMHKGKVFAGIGAAHLPGDNGVIKMLSEKGYTVKPLVSLKTAAGDQLKRTFENTIFENNYTKRTADDGFFSIDLPDHIYTIYADINTTYISPDLANGAFVIINRIRTFDQLIEDKKSVDLETIDALLFENIPGKIISKKRIKNGDYEGLDVVNKLKKGDYQRYQIYITPLEIIMFKMGGKNTFVTAYSDRVFNSITFKPLATKKITLASHYNDFSVSLPAYYNFTNNFRKGNKLIEGYDHKTKDYFFIRKATLNEYDFIEEDVFEAKQIQKRFYETLGNSKITYAEFDKNSTSITSNISVNANKKLYLKTIIKGGNYYLLGMQSVQKKTATTFFDSFQLHDYNYAKPFYKVQDTALYFTTQTTIKAPKNVNSNHPKDAYYKKKKKSYEDFYKTVRYTNNNDETIEVALFKPHDYEMFSNIDSLWDYRTRVYKDDTFVIHSSSRAVNKFSHDELNLVITDTGSNRAVKIKNTYKDGVIYELQTLLDTLGKPSKYVQEFYNNFKPNDTVIGRPLFDNKTNAFFQKLRANDSIVFSAYNRLLFRKAAVDSMKYYIADFDYPEDKIFIKNNLISSLGYRKDTDISSFFKKLYVDSYDNSYAQVEILQSLANKKSKKGLTLMLELMEKDLPLTKNRYEIDRIFYPFYKKENYELSKLLFPKILAFSTISDYKAPIFGLLAKLKEKGVVKEKIYKKYKTQIVNDAKIELKRLLSKNMTSYYNSNNSNKRVERENKLLKDYMVLLFPFRNEKAVKLFFKRIEQIHDEQITTSLLALKASNNEAVSRDKLIALAADINSRIHLFEKLDDIDRLDLFPFAYKTQRAIAESSLFSKYKFNKDKDTLAFVKKASLKIKGEKINAFVFKIKEKQGYNKQWKLKVLAFKDERILTTKIYYEGRVIKISEAVPFDQLVEKAIEKVQLEDRKRAVVEFNNYYSSYNRY